MSITQPSAAAGGRPRRVAVVAVIVTALAAGAGGCSALGIGDTPSPTPLSSSPTPEPPSLGDSVALARSGVVRIEATHCDGGVSSGSGFLVGPDMVATVAHVVDGARTLSLRTPGGVLRGEVVGVDADAEVALVRAIDTLPGFIFVFAEEPPEITEEIAVLGYHFGQPLTTNVGTVSALDRRVEFEGQSLSGLIQTDAAVNSGHSGGPMVNAAGEVLGLVEAKAGEGLGYAVPAAVAEPMVTAWAASPDDVPMAQCPDPTAELITTESRHADAPALAASFFAYFDGINRGYYGSAWEMLTGRRQGKYAGYDDFEAKQSSSIISEVVLELARRVDETSDTADVRFVSRQDPELGPDGQACSEWHLRYTMRMDSGYWRIDAAENLDDSPRACR